MGHDILHLWENFHAKFGQKIKISSESQNVKKMDSSLSFIFKTIENKMYQFELHPHISEIRTNNFDVCKRWDDKIYQSISQSQS